MQFYNDDTTWATPSQQVEPNVGTGTTESWEGEVKRLYRLHLSLFTEAMGG